jgi:hypothetical protein
MMQQKNSFCLLTIKSVRLTEEVYWSKKCVSFSSQCLSETFFTHINIQCVTYEMPVKMHVGLHVKISVILPDFSRNLNYSTTFSKKKIPHKKFRKPIGQVEH